MPTLRDLFDMYNMHVQNQQHAMLAENLMDNMRQATAVRMGVPNMGLHPDNPNAEQAPYGYAHNYTDSLPFSLNDRIFYEAPGLWDQMNNPQKLVPLQNMFAPCPPYKGML